MSEATFAAAWLATYSSERHKLVFINTTNLTGAYESLTTANRSHYCYVVGSQTCVIRNDSDMFCKKKELNISNGRVDRGIMNGRFLGVTFVACALFLIQHSAFGQRNTEEEAICQPFLTSPNSSPLVADLKRNLKYDEDCEFSCELVLQDRNLPLQIRGTIHEGLGWLAIRHMQMGLQRQRTALRHFKILSEMAPYSADFAYRTGSFLLDPVVSDPAAAVPFFHSVLYGPASNDSAILKMSKSAAWKYLYKVRRKYIQALGWTGRNEEAIAELKYLLSQHPLDFEAAHMLLSIDQQIGSSRNLGTIAQEQYEVSAVAEDHIACSALQGDSIYNAASEFYQMVHRVAQDSSDYHGFKMKSVFSSTVDETSPWQPRRFDKFPTSDDFQRFIQEREPFIVSPGGIEQLEQELRWKTSKWRGSIGKEYIADSMGDENELLVESRIMKTDNHSLPFGWGINVRRRLMPLTEVLSKDFEATEEWEFASLHHNYSNEQSDAERVTARSSLYVNIQPGMKSRRRRKNHHNDSDGDASYYSPPLDRLYADIPSPVDLLGSMVWANMSDVNLWMGHAKGSDTHSRLHFDATDNLYIVLEGSKRFSLISPDQVFVVGTVSPTIALFQDGLPFQFELDRFIHYIEKICNASLHDDSANEKFRSYCHSLFLGENAFGGDGELGNSLTAHLSRVIASRVGLEYDKSNNHFAMLDAKDSSISTLSTRNISVAHVDLAAGDILYLPAGWLHQVTSRQGFHCAVNYWWKPLNWKDAIHDENKKREAFHESLLRELIEKNHAVSS